MLRVTFFDGKSSPLPAHTKIEATDIRNKFLVFNVHLAEIVSEEDKNGL